jgi:hypothetical protein
LPIAAAISAGRQPCRLWKSPQFRPVDAGAALAWDKEMPALDIMRHMDPAQLRSRESVAASHSVTKLASKDEGEGFLETAFDDLLDIVNPLQHLPVVGTLYRAITDDKIGTVAKIAGDALYGGLWGAVGALADTAFEAVTGKDFGSTMLALAGDALGLEDDHSKPAQMAAAQTQPPLIASAGADAFGSALAAKGVDSELATRAMFAYRRANGLIPAGLN